MRIDLRPLLNPSTGKEVTNYYVTDDGRVFKEIKGTVGANGYRVLNLSRCKHTYHRIMARSFGIILDALTWVNHKDGDKLNNSINNLEPTTPKNNYEHACRMKLITAKARKDLR